MDFKAEFPDFASVAEHVHRAHVERSVYLGQLIADFIVSATRGLKRIAGSVGNGLAAERDRRAIEADAFLKRSVPRY